MPRYRAETLEHDVDEPETSRCDRTSLQILIYNIYISITYNQSRNSRILYICKISELGFKYSVVGVGGRSRELEEVVKGQDEEVREGGEHMQGSKWTA